MKILNRIHYLFFCASLFVFTNCADDLNVSPAGDIMTQDQKDQLYKTEAEKLQADVNGLYSALIKYNKITDWYGGTAHYDFGYAAACMMYDASGMDEPSESSGYNWFRRNQSFEDRTKTGDATYFLWDTFYSHMRTANAILKIAEKGTEDATLKSFRGQALTSRAFDYLNLVQIYQFTYKGHENDPAVPIITEETTDEEISNNPRATVQKVYDLIIDDLTEAISLLTTDRADKGRININVAYGLRARAYLNMEMWKEAADDAEKAMAGYTPYSISDVSKPSFNKISASSWIWGNAVTENNDIVKSGLLNFPSHMCSFTGNGYAPGYAGRYINNKLYDQISSTDVRKGWWALGDAVYDKEGKLLGYEFYDTDKRCPNVDWTWKIAYQGNNYNIAEWLGWQVPYVNVKFGPYQDIYNNGTNACDFPIMRAEEMYLIQAEGLGLGVSVAAGKAVLEEFVKTYRDPSYVCNAATAQELQDEIWLQRRIELWGEGFSFFDIKRLKKPLLRKGTNFPSNLLYDVPAESQIFLWIIPEAEEVTNDGISATDNNPVVPKPGI